MTLTASLPMYDFPEVRRPLGALWRAVAGRLREQGVEGVPEALVHDRAVHDLWSDPALLLSQCCGYDLVGRYAGRLFPVATPRYTAPGCNGSDYSSVVLVAEGSGATELEHLRGAVCVVNGLESHSGVNALRALIAPLNREGRFFSAIRVSGSHAASIAEVAEGRADVSAVDCVTYALLARYRPSALTGTRRLCYTTRAPGLPFVIRADAEDALAAPMRRALLDAFDDEEVKSACATVFIGGFDFLPPAAYQRISELEQRAIACGYPRLR